MIAGEFNHMGRAMTGDAAERADRNQRSPGASHRRTAADGVVIEEFDRETAPLAPKAAHNHG